MRQRASIYLPHVLVTLPILLVVFYIAIFGVNVPYWDAWSLVWYIQHPLSVEWFNKLWFQFGPTRPILSRLILTSLAFVTRWNLVAEMYANVGLSLLTLFGLWRIHKSIGKVGLLGFVPFAWIIFCVGQADGLLMGWYMHNFLVACFAAWTIYFLMTGTLRNFWIALLCASLASFSFSNGLALWIVGVFQLIANRDSSRRIVAWFLAGVLIIVAYLQGYSSPSIQLSKTFAVAELPSTITFLLVNIGSVLGGFHWALSFVMGVLVVTFAVLSVLILVRKQQSQGILFELTRGETAIVGLILFSFLSSIMILMGRSTLDPNTALTPRYTTMTALSLVGIYGLGPVNYLNGGL